MQLSARLMHSLISSLTDGVGMPCKIWLARVRPTHRPNGVAGGAEAIVVESSPKSRKRPGSSVALISVV